LKGILVTLLVAGSVSLAFRGSALAQGGPLLTSVVVKELPNDPDSAIWNDVPASSVPLIPQVVALPRMLDVSVPTVSVRSVNDGQRIAFLLEWADATRDVRATRPDEFRDAAAIMFPVGDFVPNICMGSPGQLANLWHWKADWQEDIERGFQDVVDAYPNFYTDNYPFVTGVPPFRAPADFGSTEARQYHVGMVAGNPLSRPDKPSPVEVLLAGGFGTSTHSAQQNVEGRGVWADGRWRVVFTRALAASDTESVNLVGRSTVPVAFAIWNGSNQEVGARKQLSGIVTVALTLGAAQAQSQLDWGLLSVVAVVLVSVIALGVGLGIRRRSANRVGRRSWIDPNP
jgi:hypothetical protein